MDAAQKMALLAVCRAIVARHQARQSPTEANLVQDQRLPRHLRKRMLAFALHEARAARGDDEFPH